MSFGIFLFGQPYFGEGLPLSGGAVASFTGFQLSISERQVTPTVPTIGSGGGGLGLSWDPKTLKFLGFDLPPSPSRQRKTIAAYADFDGFRLELTERRVKPAAGAKARARRHRRTESHEISMVLRPIEPRATYSVLTREHPDGVEQLIQVGNTQVAIVNPVYPSYADDNSEEQAMLLAALALICDEIGSEEKSEQV